MNQRVLRIRSPSSLCRRSTGRPRYASSCSSSASTASPAAKQRRWLRLAFVSVAAAGMGAYIRSEYPSSSSTLNPVTFTPYYLVSREPVSANASLFTLQPPQPNADNQQVYEDAWKTGVWSVMFKQPQLQIGRDYTPIPPTPEDNNSLRFFIRKDPFGEVSRYLHTLELGTPIEVRGPQIECEIPSDTERIVFIAGGTGIAPALQAGHTLLQRTNHHHQPQIHILWANRRREDCVGGISDTMTPVAEPPNPWYSRLFRRSTQESPLAKTSTEFTPSLMVQEIETLKSQYPKQITVDYYIDEEKTFIGKQDILKFTGTRRSTKRNMIMVSGPEGFISYMVGPKLWAQGMELQGPLRGMIAELALTDWAVWKL